jgi:hypothetical protein
LRAALVVLAGCGRIAFDPLGDAGAASEGDGNGSATACVPTAEICNGIDDDCNGIVDEGCPCNAFTSLVSHPVSPPSQLGAMLSTGNGYIVYDYELSTLDTVAPTGAITGSLPVAFVPLTDVAMWDGSALVIAHSDGASSITLAHIASDGTPTVFATIPVAALDTYAITRDYTGAYDLALTYGPGMSQSVDGVLLAADGTLLARTTLATGVETVGPVAVARAAFPVVAWTTPTETTTAAFAGSTATSSSPPGAIVHLGATATGIALVVTQGAGPSTGYTLAGDGNLAAGPIALALTGTLSSAPAISSGGSGYVIGYDGFTGAGTGVAVFHLGLDSSGNPMGSPVMDFSVAISGGGQLAGPLLFADATRAAMEIGFADGPTVFEELVVVCL